MRGAPRAGTRVGTGGRGPRTGPIAAAVRRAIRATWRVWFDWTPPIETSVSAPWASASASRYSSLRTLFPPNARPELQSSRFAQTVAPPRCLVRRSRRWIGDGPKRSG